MGAVSGRGYLPTGDDARTERGDGAQGCGQRRRVNGLGGCVDRWVASGQTMRTEAAATVARRAGRTGSERREEEEFDVPLGSRQSALRARKWDRATFALL